MPLETLNKCPVCQQTEPGQPLTAEDHTVSHEKFSIQNCAVCGFLYTNPRPDESSIGPYYESNEYISHHDDTPTLMGQIYKAVRDYTVRQKIKMLNSFHPGKGSILDIGCGTGIFIEASKKNGWNITGIEPDSDARKIASKRIQKPVHQSIFQPALAEEKYDVITMWHVLEHVHRLEETLLWLSSHLNSNGKIIIAVPNHRSYDAVKYGTFWAAYDVPRHLYHFNTETMKRLLDRHGLSLDYLKPMWFDSAYVSMLSTKYRSGSVNLPESILTGLISNWKGRQTKTKPYNTSSLIYIISKK
jgi:2-polyprenyl-3-methyl-5-hydroxy-6-metoxy-1,4-benzoquinol methylase